MKNTFLPMSQELRERYFNDRIEQLNEYNGILEINNKGSNKN